MFWSLLEAIIPSSPQLFREEKIKYIFNSAATMLDASCDNKGHPPHAPAPVGMQTILSLLESSRENHIILFSNASRYRFDLLYGQSIFINSGIHPKVDFL